MNINIKVFLMFSFGHMIYQAYNMYVGKYASDLKFLNFSFDNYYTYTLGVLIAATPFLSIANYVFGIGFHVGYKNLEKIWIVLIIFIASQIFSSLLSAIVFYNELPSKGSLVGLVFALVGLLISNLWR